MTNKVLLIEDDPDIREIVDVILKSQSYDIIQAANGTEGLARLRQTKPALIILDLLMPGMDGFNFYKALKSPEWLEYRDIPVMFLTSVDKDASQRRYELETGFKLAPDAYLDKPVVPAVLIETVRELLHRSPG